MEQQAVLQTQTDLREFYAKVDLLKNRVSETELSIESLKFDKVDKK